MRKALFIATLIVIALSATILYQKTQKSDISYYTARRFFEKGEYYPAIKLYKKSLILGPKRVDALTDLAYCYQWTGKQKEAIDTFQKALSIDPKDNKIKESLAETYSWTKNYKKSIELYKEVIDATGSAGAKRSLAEVYIWDQKPDKARGMLEAILSDDPSDNRAKLLLAKAMHYSGEAKEATVIYEEILEAEKPKEEEEASVKGEIEKLLDEAYMIGKDYKKAIGKYREILEKDPENTEVRIALAEILSWDKKYDEAINEYKEVLRINPANPKAMKNLAEVYSWKGDFKKSEELYKEIIKENPENLNAYRELARILTWGRKYEEAFYYFDIVLSKSEDKNLRLLYGEALLYSGDYKRAEEVLSEIVQKSPENIAARMCLADTFAYSKRFKEAIALYREILQEKDDPEVKEKLADVLSWDKRYPESFKLYDEVIKETGSEKVRLQKARALGWAKDYRKALLEYRKLYEDTGDRLVELEMKAKEAYWGERVKRAIHYYNELLSEDPQNSEAMFDLAQIYSYQWMWKKATGEYKKILKIYPTHFRAREGLTKDELISKHILFKAGYEFFEGDSPSRDVDIRRHTAFSRLSFPYKDKFRLDINYDMTYRTFADFNDVLENKAMVSAEYRNNPDWWLDGFYSLFAYSRGLKVMHNFGGKFNFRVFDMGVSASSYERKRLQNNSGVIRKSYYQDAFKERLDFDVTKRLRLGCDYVFSHYSDGNYRNEPAFDVLYYFSLDPMRFSVKYRYFFREFKKKVKDYFSPKGFTTNIVTLNWRHYLNKEEVFFGADDLYYDLQYEMRVDSQTIVGHGFTGELNWDVNKRFNLNLKAKIVNSSANVYNDKSLIAGVKYYF